MTSRLAAAALRLRSWTRRRLLLDARRPLAHLLAPGFVAIDLETTGLDPRHDAIVAVAAIPFVNGRAGPGYVTLVNPERPIPPAATAIHGIDDTAAADAPAARDVLPRLAAACGHDVLVGYDVHFDLAVLRRTGSPVARALARRVVLDSRRLAEAVQRRGSHRALEVVAASLGLDVSGRHTAEGDARMAGEILLALLPALEARGARTLADLVRLQRAAPG
jgi:DNA polymerase III epsilon subunit family exonuclease